MSDESAEMTAMVLRSDRSIGLERRPTPTPRGDQVLVDIDLCGICGSDLHASQTSEVYLGGFVMGHEPVGRIARVGRDVTGWHVGQRVCINPNGDTCGVCEACRSGRLNHCIPATMQRAIGLQADGALAAQVAVSPKTLHAVPDEMGRIESMIAHCCLRTIAGSTRSASRSQAACPSNACSRKRECGLGGMNG